MRCLELTLFKKWFYQILSGEKTIEYRECKNYWNKRLIKHYDIVRFRNGYSKNLPQITCEIKHIRRTLTSWEIHLGKILNTANIPPQINL